MWHDSEDDASLIKIRDTESSLRWNNVLSNVDCYRSRFFDIYIFNSWLEIFSNLLYFEKLYHMYQLCHLSQINTSENIEEISKIIRSNQSMIL